MRRDTQAWIIIAGLLDPLEGDLTALQMREVYADGSPLASRKHAVFQALPGKGDAFDVETAGRQVER